MRKSKLKIINDAICGIASLLSILVYLLIGVFANVWHPTWMIMVITEFVCAILTIVINACLKIRKLKSEKEENINQ